MMVLLLGEDLFGLDGFHVAETILHDREKTFLHTHDFCELFLVTEGSLLHLINGREVPLPTNALCLVYPQDVHQFRKGDCAATHFINIAFPEALLARALSVYAGYSAAQAWDGNGAHVCHLPFGLAQSCLLRIAFLAKKTPGMNPLFKQELLLNLLLESLAYFSSDIAGEAMIPEWLQSACQAIAAPENYTQGLKRFVALSGKSQEHMTRSMRKYYNTTPAHYLGLIQLEAAAHLLKTTDDPVLDVLLQCGFNNVSYFNQLFKRTYGVTPTRYRQLNKAVVNPRGGRFSE